MLTIATGKEVALLLFHTPKKYGSDRFRQIFIDHWERWWDYRQEEIPADQRTYVQKMVEKMMGCRPKKGGCALILNAATLATPVLNAMKNGLCPSQGTVPIMAW